MDFLLIYLFVAGLFFGSFFHVVSTRRVNNESIIKPRSHCTNCNHVLSWYELIPIISYIFLKGKCKECKIHISLEYPLVELITGILFALSYYIFGVSYQLLISLVVVSMVVCIFISDCHYYVILDEVLVTATILLIPIYFFKEGMSGVINHGLYGIIIFITFVLIKLLGDTLFKKESLGWGDIKLSFISGMILGIPYGFIYIFLGSILALPYAIFASIFSKNPIVPFGPFLASSLLIIFWNLDFISNLITIWLGI